MAAREVIHFPLRWQAVHSLRFPLNIRSHTNASIPRCPFSSRNPRLHIAYPRILKGSVCPGVSVTFRPPRLLAGGKEGSDAKGPSV
jgi:hypothetical protein